MTPCPTSEDIIKILIILAQQYIFKNMKNNLAYPSKTKMHGEIPIANIIVKIVKGRLLKAGGLKNCKKKYRGAFFSLKFPHPLLSAPKIKLELNKKIIRNNINNLARIFFLVI